MNKAIAELAEGSEGYGDRGPAGEQRTIPSERNSCRPIQMKTTKRILIIEAQMKQYRLPFYTMLQESLRKEGMRLRVVYSEPIAEEAQKRDNCDLPAEFGVKVKGYWFWNKRFLLQPAFREITAADLVIVDQANKLVMNHLLLPLALLGIKRVAFWGLGKNLQAERSSASEWHKRRTMHWVDWWFAYTHGTAEYLQREGVPASKISAVQNSVDTRLIQSYVHGLDKEAKARIRARLGIPSLAPVGIFVGMLQKVKSLPFLFDVSQRIRKQIPDFHLIVVGGGPEEREIEVNASQQSWIHFVGPQFGDRKAELLGIADVFLLPGRVGLAILDGFAAGLPLVATRLPIHGPEMEYLEEGRNGVTTPHDPSCYAQAVIHLFTHQAELSALRDGARRSAGKYSIENMVENFSNGIVQCLGRRKAQPNNAEMKETPGGLKPATEWETWRWPTAAVRTKPDAGRALDLRARMTSSSAFHGPLMTTSWDDGHPLDFRIAELLEKYGMSGTFYVPRTSQDAVMHPRGIRELGRRFEIGAHTLEHVRIDRLEDGEAFAQLSGSRQWVEDVTGKSCEVFCFPGGTFKKRQLRLVQEAGFRAARTVELLSTAEPHRVDGLCVIPTTIQAFPHGKCAYVRNSLRRFSATFYLALRSTSSSGDWVAQATEMLARTIERGGVFHLWGHSWEIEQEGQWQQLESFLSFVRTKSPSLQCVTNSELVRLTGASAPLLQAGAARRQEGRA
jgi:glycosyltransferase involved in cell wall biosynthesis